MGEDVFCTQRGENMRLGIAGYMGGGKSTAARFLCHHFDWYCIDADKEARTLMTHDRKIIAEVADAFDVVVDGVIDFKELGSLVFADVTQLYRLNSIVHPPLIAQLKNQQKKAEEAGKHSCIDGALLPQWDAENLIEHGVWIEAERSLRIVRLCQRTGLDKQRITERVAMQETTLKSPQDARWHTIDNSVSTDALFDKLTQWGIRVTGE